MHDHTHHHFPSHHQPPSRRDFFRLLIGGPLAGASILELAWHRAAWGRALASTADASLFAIEKVAEGVYFAQAQPQAQVNCNAAIFVNSSGVLVVDTHSKPSAAAWLIAQIKQEITAKPVRYVVNTHFHWDHIQGNQAYRAGGGKIEFIASQPTSQLMSDFAQRRFQATLDEVPKQIDTMRVRAGRSSTAAEKAFCEEQVRQMQAYQSEMKNFKLELPTITFEKSYVIKEGGEELHLEFHGRAHTAGDVVVLNPAKRVAATGDMIHSALPYMADGFPKSWPKTIDSVAGLGFDKVCPGHGAVQHGRQIMTGMRNYIEELTVKVEAGKKAGKSITDLQKTITMASLKSMQADGYGQFLSENAFKHSPRFGPGRTLQSGVNANIADIYNNLEKI
jgi:glyoxylase-like metal-dependent hydrolase (beta-lactamase superfamily II)